MQFHDAVVLNRYQREAGRTLDRVIREDDRQTGRHSDEAALADGLQGRRDSLGDSMERESSRGVHADGGGVGRKRAEVDGLGGRKGRGGEVVRVYSLAPQLVVAVGVVAG